MPEDLSLLFTASAQAEGGRQGRVQTGDGLTNLPLSVPKAMGGIGQMGTTTPEALLAAALSASFGSSVAYVAATESHSPAAQPLVTVDALVGLGVTPRQTFGLAITLTVNIAGHSAASALALAEQARAYCPLVQALEGNVALTLNAR